MQQGLQSLNVRRVSKRYLLGTRHKRELWALRDVSFAVNRGEILGIIGPNGAGKTTLLKVLSRVTPPTEGRIVGSGRVVPLLALGAGFQQDVSGRDNIFLNAAIYGISADEVESRLDEIVGFADIGEFIDVPVKKYSSGMYLRLAFSVAINMRPDILLADEVLAVGDIDFQERCLERVKQIGQGGMSVLFVSHDMTAITRLCDRVMWLSAGEVVQIGDPEEVVAAYQSAAWSRTGRRPKDNRSGGHKNDFAEIQFVMLTASDGREIGAVRVEDEVSIKAGVRLLQPGISLKFVFHIRTQGVLAFRTRSGVYPALPPGVHTASIRIPAHLLAETIYTVSVDVILVDNGEALKPISAFNALSFQVFNAVSGRRDPGGIVAPKLAWALETVVLDGARGDT
ncbi:MAG: polysaccharide ABC transporter ATP-binding protein [Vicinamibacterales bacterium]